MDINQKVLAAFQCEQKEQIEALRSIVATALAGGEVPFEEALRLAHTMKGGARVCGLNGIQELAHRMESIFARMRDRTLPMSGEVAGTITHALDVIEGVMVSVAAGRAPSETIEALQRIESILAPPQTPEPKKKTRDDTKQRVLAAFQSEQQEYLEAMRAILAKGDSGGGSAGAMDMNEMLRLAHTLKGGARITGLQPIEKLAHQMESVFASLRDGSLKFDVDTENAITLALNSIEDWMASLGAGQTSDEPAAAFAALENLLRPRSQPEMAPEPAGAESSAVSTAAFPRELEMVRLSREHLDRLLRSSGQLATESLRQDQVSRALSELARGIDELEREWEAVRDVSAAHLHRMNAIPESARVLRYLQFLERQARSLSRRAREVCTLQQRSSRSVRVLGEEVSNNVRMARLIPAENVFGVFRKMVRDVARDEKKKIEFQVSGLEVQADRMVLQALKDPVMHMLRNAISHGIESIQERVALGKSEAGRITLRMEASGNRLSILIDDDGRGIDLERVKEVALRKGLLTAADAAQRSPEELSRLIFQPGFSTARTITDLSGRGMGLSVVHEAVLRLQGEVRVLEKDGAGAKVALLVPLSISTHRLLLVSCLGQTYAVPSSGIERLIGLKIGEIETIEGKPLVFWEDQPVSVVTLAQLLGASASELTVGSERLSVMILKAGTRKLAVVVDEFIAERETYINNLDAPASGASMLGGGIFLEDGSVALVLNPAEIIERFKPVSGSFAVKAGEVEVRTVQPTVLVVDDSFTARTLEKSILEVHGYTVIVAMDGLEALSKLRSEKIDLVISDVQMPRMDGLGLLQEMKKDKRFAPLPVILLTSLDRTEDQERGLTLGADAYLVKQRFDHQTLLETIRQLL